MEPKQLQTYATDKAFDPIYVTDNSELMAKNAADLNQSMEVYGQMQRENDRRKIQAAKQKGEGLIALSKFSKQLTNHLVKQQQQKNQRDMEEGLALAYSEGINPEEMAAFDAEESALIQTDAQIREVGGALPSTTSPDVRRGVANMSGWKGYGYAQGMAQRGAMEYPMAYQQLAQQVEVTVGGKAITLNTAQTGPERQAVEAEIRRQFLSKYAGMNTALLGKYLFPKMRQYETQQYMEWQDEQNEAFEREQKDEAKEFLYDSIKTGRGGEGVMQFIEQYSGTFGGRSKTWDVLVDELESGIENRELNAADIQAIKDTVVTVDGKKVRIGDRWSRRFRGMDDKLHSASLTDSNQRQQEEALLETQFQDQVEEATKAKMARGEQWDEGDIDELEKKWKSMTGKEPPSWLSNMKTKEDADAKTIRERLITLRRNRGYLTEYDLRDVPSSLWQEFNAYVQNDAVLAKAAEGFDGSAKERIGAMVNSITKEQDGLVDKSDQWFNIRDNMIEDYTSIRNDLIQKGTSPADAHKEALRLVKEKVQKSAKGADGGATTDWMQADKVPYNNEGSLQDASERVQINTIKNSIEKDPSLLESKTKHIPGIANTDLMQAEAYVKGETTVIPKAFEIAARASRKVTAYDVMMNQLEAAGIKIESPIHEAVDEVDPEVQQLLKFRPTVSRVNRAIVAGGPAVGDSLVAMVIQHESAAHGTWDAYNQGGRDNGNTAVKPGNSAISSPWGKPVSQMTLGEISYYQSLPVGHPKVLHGAGAFQFTKSAFSETMKSLGLSPEQTFDQATQLAFFNQRRKWRESVDPGVDGLRREWVGLNNASYSEIEKAMNIPYYQRPSNMLPELAYISGNIGPTSTGPHLDVKQVGGGNFSEDALDEYVYVDDPEYGKVTLGEIRKRTGGIGDNQAQHRARGSHGIDYGLHTGTKVFVRNGAKVIGSRPSAHGDVVTIQLPNGKKYTFLHGNKG